MIGNTSTLIEFRSFILMKLLSSTIIFNAIAKNMKLPFPKTVDVAVLCQLTSNNISRDTQAIKARLEGIKMVETSSRILKAFLLDKT